MNRDVSIWFLIGMLLVVYGVLITGAGVYGVSHPPPVRLAELHAGVGWGLRLLAVGGGYCSAYFPGRRGRQR